MPRWCRECRCDARGIMSEYRQDPVTENWVIVAQNRGERPDEFGLPSWKRQSTICPFCRGQEEETPPEIARYALPEDGSWGVRVVPNKFPAVTDCACPPGPERGLFTRMEGCGAHEVIIESPAHVVSLTELPEIHAVLAFRAYADRLRAHRAAANYGYGIVFKNVGAEAGASLEHVHSQVLATSLTPPAVHALHARWKRRFQQEGRQVFQEFLDGELAAGIRVVARSDRFVAVCPFASRVPYEVRILPLAQGSHFEEVDLESLAELAILVRDLTRRVELATNRGAYNLIIHTAPFDTLPYDYYHWHIEILPRLTRAAGFEWGSGCFINPLAPEEAADRLRQLA
jgi:UDPglucose--hexose-1-phosphate uridylyltransferase